MKMIHRTSQKLLFEKIDGVEKSYEDGTAALRSLTDKYEVKEIIEVVT